jgi:uncharacterized cupredoxin-like copper-binding protein
MRKRLSAVAAVTAWFAVGAAAPAAHATLPGTTRKLTYIMTDFKFSPKSKLAVRKGETITFVFVNKGKVVHEAFFGTKDQQKQHSKVMSGSATTVVDATNQVSAAPGATKTIKVRFPTAGSFEMGCHIPGHYQAGMKVAITVG